MKNLSDRLKDAIGVLDTTEHNLLYGDTDVGLDTVQFARDIEEILEREKALVTTVRGLSDKLNALRAEIKLLDAELLAQLQAAKQREAMDARLAEETEKAIQAEKLEEL